MFRDQFRIFDESIFINSCSKGALASPVRDAYLQYLDDWQTLGSPWELWVGKLETLRGQFARFINATASEIALKTSVSDALNVLASSLDFSGKRSQVVVDDFAFPTTGQVWHAQEVRGAEVIHVPEADNSTIPLEHYRRVINDQTMLVVLTHVCYRHGGRQDIREIAKIAHEAGAMVLVDSYQALGTLQVDVRELGIDFLVGGALKYLLGSSGLAYLYVAQQHIQRLVPVATGWFAQENIFAMNIFANEPSHSARRFESGTPPNPNIYAAIAGLEVVHQVGLSSIHAQISNLTGSIVGRAHEEGYQIATPASHGAMIALRARDADRLVQCLAGERIIVSARDGNVRVSPHFYNEEQDIDLLFRALAMYDYLLM